MVKRLVWHASWLAAAGGLMLTAFSGHALAGPASKAALAGVERAAASGVVAKTVPPRRAAVLHLTDVPRPAATLKVVKIGRMGVRAGAGSAAMSGDATTPAAPFAQCPAIGDDASCGILINVIDGGSQVLTDPAQEPYDGDDDTLVGVLNSSSW